MILQSKVYLICQLQVEIKIKPYYFDIKNMTSWHKCRLLYLDTCQTKLFCLFAEIESHESPGCLICHSYIHIIITIFHVLSTSLMRNLNICFVCIFAFLLYTELRECVGRIYVTITYISFSHFFVMASKIFKFILIRNVY